MDDTLSDAALIAAARKRILRELEAQKEAHQQSIINNYGGSSGTSGTSGGGLLEAMHGGKDDDEDLKDYFVDIERRDLPELNENGKSVGWSKKVHRHSAKRGGK